ncbi:MAG: arginyltransferase [Kangiellaceae bacterium]|nr:arginyltransferase [Kangiellaceae bacterium]
MNKLEKNTNQLDFYITPEHECPYLTEKQSQTVFLNPEVHPHINIYQWLIDKGFRRSGEHIYRPQCADCRACISIRVSPSKFNPSKQQKRCAKNGKRFTTRISPALYDQQHYQLFESYINARHKDGDMYPTSEKQYKEFILSDWANTQFLDLVDPMTGRLIACSVFDELTTGLSAIYTFFDVEYSKFSLGRLAVLKLIEHCQYLELEHVYLGYWIKNSPKMSYKGEYRPLECFIEDRWISLS